MVGNNRMAAASENTPAVKTKDFIETFAAMMDAYPAAGLREIIRMIPDGLFVGTGLFSILSQNYSVAILFLTIFETLLITVGLQNLFGYISLPDLLPKAEALGQKCVSGFQSPTLNTLSIFFKMGVVSSFPSPPIFVYMTSCIYILSCAQQFFPEMEELGPGFSTRFYIGLILSILALLIISIFRLLTGCDTMGAIAFSIIAGLVLGIVLCFQNKTIFGKEAINLMGIPYFTNTAADGKPIYICPKNLVPRQ